LSDLDAVGDATSQARALAAGLLADCSTRIVYRQETDQLTKAAAALGLSRPERELLPHLQRGSGLWKIGRSNHVIHHQLHACAAHAFPGAADPTNPCSPTVCERVVYSTDFAMTGGQP
jgi:hypothetical protein